MHKISLKSGVDNYCVIGNPVTHSKSPLIHAAFAKQTGQKIHYQKIQVEQGEFLSALDDFQKQGGNGLNITIPFKEEAWRAADVLTDSANQAGAVNTMWFDKNGKRHGDNTDGRGLIIDLRANHNVRITGAEILILGAGGAVRGILGPLLDKKPAHVVIVNRTISRAEQLVALFSNRGVVAGCDYDYLPGQKFNLVINGTSASLQGTVPPLPGDLLFPEACCYDLMYSDSDTPFVSWARSHNAAKSLDGFGMLVEQAAESFFVWRGIRPQTRPVIETLRSKSQL